MEKVYLAIALDNNDVVAFDLRPTIHEAEEWANTLREMTPYRFIIFEIGSDGEAWKLVDRLTD
jgi:hypothetical protein